MTDWAIEGVLGLAGLLGGMLLACIAEVPVVELFFTRTWNAIVEGVTWFGRLVIPRRHKR